MLKNFGVLGSWCGCVAACLLTSGCGPSKAAFVRTIHATSDIETSSPHAGEAEAGDKFEWHARAEGIVAPGFEIELTSPADEKLNGKYRVAFDGIVELPYGVRVRAAGLSDAQLKKEIGRAYTEYFRSEPNVLVTVSSRMYWVDVRGLVDKPGQYLVRRDSSLDEVLSAAGGLANGKSDQGADAGVRYVRVTQAGRAILVNLADYFAGLQPVSPRWQGGETLFVQTSAAGGAASGAAGPAVVQVLGQVKNPGEYQYSAEQDVVDYLVRAGGPTERATLSRVEIIRRDGAEKKAILFSLEQSEERLAVPALQAGDILMIHADNLTETERATRTASEISTIITGIATVVILALTL